MEHYSIPTPSAEQNAIITAVRGGTNVIVNAVAGSGKTTGMLHIGRELINSRPGIRILILTYNARLKDETREKIKLLGLNGIEAHSYHAFCVRYYSPIGMTDSGIIKIVNMNLKPTKPFWFDQILLDEVQDMTNLYYRLVNKIIADSNYAISNSTVIEINEDQTEDELIDHMSNLIIDDGVHTENVFDDDDDTITQSSSGWSSTKLSSESLSFDNDEIDFTMPFVMHHEQPSADLPIQPAPSCSIGLCVFGDPRQNIYAFKDADDRFLTMADKLWTSRSELKNTWSKLPLKTSFRITTHMANFVNRVMLSLPVGDEAIVANKTGVKVKYMLCNSYGPVPRQTINTLLASGYKPSDVFVIAPSIRNINSPIRDFENDMVKRGIPCFVPNDDDGKLDQSVIAGKMVFSSFHQTKGLERKIVIIFGFDETYFKFFNKNANPELCPNELYVAATRAKEHLIVIHDYKQNYLPFLNLSCLEDVADVKKGKHEPKQIAPDPRLKFSVSELTRHLSTPCTDDMMNMLCWVRLEHPRPNLIRPGCDFTLHSPISIPSIVKGTTGMESVSEINGICIPTIYEYRTVKPVVGAFGPVKGVINVVKVVDENIKFIDIYDRHRVQQICDKVNNGKPSISDFLQLSNFYSSLCTGYMFKTRQIDNYDWMDPRDLESAIKLITKYIPVGTNFEVSMEAFMIVNGMSRNISGRVDAMVITNPEGICKSLSDGILPDDTVRIWEFKCVKELNNEHILQLADYAWLFQKNHPMVRAYYYLLNILDDTLIEIVVSPYDSENLNKIVHKQVLEKIKVHVRGSDEDFLAANYL